MKYALLFIATILFAAPASAEDYEKGPNGGLMLDVAGIDAELMTAGNTVTINVFEAFKAKPVSTKGYVGAVLIADPLLPCRLHAALGDWRHRLPEQGRDLRSAVQGLVGNDAHHRRRPQASRS